MFLKWKNEDIGYDVNCTWKMEIRITKNGYELIKDEKVDYVKPTCSVIGSYWGKILQNTSRLFILRIRTTILENKYKSMKLIESSEQLLKLILIEYLQTG